MSAVVLRYADLRDADPQQWHALAAALREWRERLLESGYELRNEVCTPLLDGSNNRVWTGMAQQGAALRVDDVRRSVFQLADEVLPIADGVDTFADRLAELRRLAADTAGRALGQGWIVGDDGSVEIPPNWTGPDGRNVATQGVWAEAEGIATDIGRFVGQAQSEDHTVRGLLDSLAGLRLNVEQWGAADRAVDAEALRAAELANQSDAELSRQERDELERLLATHGADPTFASRFYDEVGPRRVLELGAGDVLARVTDPAVDPMSEAHTRAVLDAVANWEGEPADRGWALLGLALHDGEYSRQFLTPVGDAMIERDRHQPLGDGGPLVGLLVALDGNPEAATEFFDPAREYPGRQDGDPTHLQYLLEDREWPPVGAVHTPDGVWHRDVTASLAYDLLGNALEAATIERPPSLESTRVFSEVISVLGDNDLPDRNPLPFMGGGQGVEIDPSMRDSLGRMIAGHIESVYSGVGLADDEVPVGSVEDTARYPGAAEFEALIRPEHLALVLNEVTRDPNAYADVHDALTVHTALLMQAEAQQAVADPATGVLDVADTSARLFGMLNESRAHAVADDFGGDGSAFDSAMTGGGLIAGIGAAALPGAGSGLAGLGVTETVDALREAAIPAAADAYADQHRNGSYHVITLTEQALLNAGLVNPAAQAAWDARNPGGVPVDLGSMSAEQRNNYDRWAAGYFSDEGPFPPGLRARINGYYNDGIDNSSTAGGWPVHAERAVQ